MPELPDLEAVKHILGSRIAGIGIDHVEVALPLVIRQPVPEEFVTVLESNSFKSVQRRGKYLLFNMASGHVLAIHQMLTGRLQYCEAKTNRKAKTCFILKLDNGRHLRYFDSKAMGKIYLVENGRLSDIPRWREIGPDALDTKMTPDVFQQRIRYHSGQIKSILTNETFITGIGNAYADEILFEAGIYPFWPRTSLSVEETERLYNAMHKVLQEATEKVTELMGEDISAEIRGFLKVHRKGGKPCPVCGSRISQVQANRRITSYCQNCQQA